jgi:hypothetical protein
MDALPGYALQFILSFEQITKLVQKKSESAAAPTATE